MRATYTQFFHFSAGYEQEGRFYGHNYTLGVTVEAPAPLAEDSLDQAVREAVIQKMDSRDLGRDVDFLKNVVITDLSLLEAVWGRAAAAVRPALLKSLSLEKGKGRKTVLEA